MGAGGRGGQVEGGLIDSGREVINSSKTTFLLKKEWQRVEAKGHLHSPFPNRKHENL